LYFGLWLSGGSSSPFLFSTNFVRVAISGRGSLEPSQNRLPV
jgi:hypothetical protein